jgi:RecA-family ATPase
VLVIIDTFARAIPGGNENDALDVGIAVAGADRIRAETGAAVGFVHHAGKDPTKGARSSSALRAATDTEIKIEGITGTRTATVTKQRDLESGRRCPLISRPLKSAPILMTPRQSSAASSTRRCTGRHQRTQGAHR